MALSVRPISTTTTPEDPSLELTVLLRFPTLMHQHSEDLMSHLNGSIFDARRQIRTLGTLLVESTASLKRIASQDLLNTNLDLGDCISVRLPMPDRNLVVAVFQ